jgi:hypothetical protein
MQHVSTLKIRSRPKIRYEALAYLAGFIVVAVPGTLLLLSTGKLVVNWELAALFIAEFSCGELMRTAYVLHSKGTQHESMLG